LADAAKKGDAEEGRIEYPGADMFLAERLVSVICGHFKGTHEAMDVSKIEQSRSRKVVDPFL
jgi:hypothetical protein